METPNVKSFEAPCTERVRKLPLGWGDAELTRFFQLAEDNLIATFAGERGWVEALIQIDQHLTTRAPDFFHEVKPELVVTCQLFMRSFGTFRAACRLALSGHVFETTVLVRSFLESAAYGWACAVSEDHRRIWKDRSTSDRSRDACRTEFGIGKIVALMRKSAGDAVAERFKAQYAQSIDFGAHPNIEGVTLSASTQNRGDGKFSLDAIYLHGHDGIRFSILEVVRAIHIVYELLEVTIRERLQILNIDQDVRAFLVHVLDQIASMEREDVGSSRPTGNPGAA